MQPITIVFRNKMAEALEGFECFNRRVRQPLGFRLKQPARELVFQTNTGHANFSSPALADAAPKAGRLLLGTVRSHDQWNTTIYSDDDRYRGVKNLRTLVFMNRDGARLEELRPRGPHQLCEGRFHTLCARLSRHSLQPAARFPGGLHARNQRALPHR